MSHERRTRSLNAYLRKLNRKEEVHDKTRYEVERSPQLVVACLTLWVLAVFLFVVVIAAWNP